MAGTVQRLIRHVWGFISSPANIENKQQSFNEGDNGSGRDRTQQVAKGPTGIEHVFITVDEVEDYVQNEINASSLIEGSVYVKVATIEELDVALSLSTQDTYAITIYCDGGTGNGVVLNGDSKTFTVTGNKKLIGTGSTAISIDSFGATTDLLFNTSVGAQLDIVDRLNFRAHGTTLNIGNIGEGTLRISEIKGNSVSSGSDTLNIYHEFSASNDPDKCLLENNNTPIPVVDADTKMKFFLWSGKYMHTKETDYKVNSRAVTQNRIVERRGDFWVGTEDDPLIWVNAELGAFSSGRQDFYFRGYYLKSDLNAIEHFRLEFLRNSDIGYGNKTVFSVKLEDNGVMYTAIRVLPNGDLYTDNFSVTNGVPQFPILPTSGTGNPVYIDSSGDLWENTSSRRFKENITSIDGFDTSDVLKLTVKKFNRIGQTEIEYSPIAEEAHEVNPLFATYDKDGKTPRGINQNNTVYALLEEVKKLRKELDELKG